MRMDTRTSPEEKTVFLFSGLLYCGNCGCNMIRKTVPAGKKKYIYYVCSGNKTDKSCTAKGVRDTALTESIFCAVKNRIDEVINMETLLSFVDNAAYLKIRVQNLSLQLGQRENEMKQYELYKKALYEALVEKTISKSDYTSFYNDYTHEYEQAEEQLKAIHNEIEVILNNKDENSVFIDSFKKYHNLKELSRSVVIDLINTITINSSKEIIVSFSYSSEFAILKAILETSQKEAI